MAKDCKKTFKEVGEEDLKTVVGGGASQYAPSQCDENSLISVPGPTGGSDTQPVCSCTINGAPVYVSCPK